MYVALSAQVSWIRQRDVHILTMGGVVYTSDPRVAVSQTGSGGGDLWTMTIRSTKVSDSSRYECQVNTEPKKSKEFSLRVVGKETKCALINVGFSECHKERSYVSGKL